MVREVYASLRNHFCPQTTGTCLLKIWESYCKKNFYYQIKPFFQSVECFSLTSFLFHISLRIRESTHPCYPHLVCPRGFPIYMTQTIPHKHSRLPETYC